MITRKLGGFLRGNATPFQIAAACVLGAMLGFTPGFTRTPALNLVLVAVLLVLNANLGLALLVSGLARVVSLLAVGVSFQIGRFLLDGPTTGLFRSIVNAPFLAWCGFETYAVTGGIALGLVLGSLAGWILARTITAFRSRMVASLGTPSRLLELAAKPWARFLTWLLFGSAGKKSWEEKLAQGKGNPVRLWGVALVAVLLVAGYFGQRPLASLVAERGLRFGLESANGATVDLARVELDLEKGLFAVSGLAMADPEALERDLLRAAHLEADIDQADFLRRRFHVSNLVISAAESGSPRAVPGERLAPGPDGSEAPEETDETRPGVGDFNLEDVLEEAKVWKERLSQARHWLERLAGPEDEGTESEEEGETLSERLAREVREKGWFGVRADHLIEEAPTVRISRLAIEGFQSTNLPGRQIDLNATELSSHPALVDEAPRIELATRDGQVGLVIELGPASRAGGNGALRFFWKGLAVDEVMGKLRLTEGAPFQGGTLDLDLDGSWDRGRIGWIDLPLRVTLHDTLLRVKGVKPQPIERLELPIDLKGPIDAPRIHFDSSALSTALVAAGKKELANKVQGALEGKVGEQLDELREKTGIEIPKELEEKVPDAKGLLDGILGGKKKKDGF